MGDSESVELLELAAKAAGKRIVWERPYVAIGDFAQTAYDAVTEVAWNPLTDDGDALRLAVKLNLHMGLEDNVANVWKGGMFHWSTEKHNDDPEAATRLAIVRAAAEIGKAMP